ncbi:hypothetical protein AX17_005821 [Amanita inopinata Kibby_2008]|nr:hypothetical protein AX17_005821 [Amanita inopinata Kibby_2008]
MNSVSKRTPVIIDTDPGVDDILAILLALASPELEILAIIVTFGNTDQNACFNNVLKAYQVIARHLEAYPADRNRFPNFCPTKKTILARGCDCPLEGQLHSAQYFHGRDGLGDISTRHPELDITLANNNDHPQLQLTDRSGVDVALGLIRDHPPQTVTYIALGPLTTLASIARRGSNILHDRIGRVVCMGGALDVPGNVSPVAEFNFYADPFAVRELLLPSDNGETRLPLDRFLLLSLDITTNHELPFPLYKDKVDPWFFSSLRPSVEMDKSPMTHFTSSFLERTREIMVKFGKDAMELHDIVAVWCAIENPPSMQLNNGWQASERKFDVERAGELTRGMVVVDRRMDTTAYAPGANRSEIQVELDKLGVPHGVWESTALPAPVEVECVADTVTTGSGVPCIIQTPGSMILLQLLIERVTTFAISDALGGGAQSSPPIPSQSPPPPLMTRGRKKDLTIPTTRALIQQRDYRARRARYVASLEDKCRRMEEENAQLRRDLATARENLSAPSSSYAPEVAEASTQLLHHLSLASASLSRFQQLAFPSRPVALSCIPPSSTSSAAANLRPAAFPSPTSSQPAEADPSHLEAQMSSPGSSPVSSPEYTFGDHEGMPGLKSRSVSPGCCGGILDCRELIETEQHESFPTRMSGLRSTSAGDYPAT